MLTRHLAQTHFSAYQLSATTGGDVMCTTFITQTTDLPNLSLYKMVVLPAESRPSMSILMFLFLNSFDNCFPIFMLDSPTSFPGTWYC